MVCQIGFKSVLSFSYFHKFQIMLHKGFDLDWFFFIGFSCLVNDNRKVIEGYAYEFLKVCLLWNVVCVMFDDVPLLGKCGVGIEFSVEKFLVIRFV